MPCLLLAECLNEVFENLEDDKITLHSCLLVNHLWCKVSVRILWRNIWDMISYNLLLSTLISCLPNESKGLLRENEIFISTLKPPLFNYVSFFKVLSINKVSRIIYELNYDEDKKCLVAGEILKMFMNQISSLKKLTYYKHSYVSCISNIFFTHFPGARDCLTDLSELCCNSDIQIQLSQICNNLQSLTIVFNGDASNELKELISSQNNLKCLKLKAYGISWVSIIPALKKLPDTLTKLHLYGSGERLSLSFVPLFLNLQEIILSFVYVNQFDFKELQYVTFPKLQILKIPYRYPKHEYMTKFLEINGKNLEELNLNNVLNLSIDKFCPNLRKLLLIFSNDKLDTLKTIFDSCQYLESIVIMGYLSEKNLLETVAKHSPKNFCELILQDSTLFPEDLESFFISWKNRTPKKSLSIIIVDDDDNDNSLKVSEENMKLVEKYINLGVIKKFEIREYDDEDESYLYTNL